MTHEQMFSLKDQVRFQPYVLKTTGGREYKIESPECMLYGGMRTVVLLFGDHWSVLDIEQIESIEKESSNGGGSPGLPSSLPSL